MTDDHIPDPGKMVRLCVVCGKTVDATVYKRGDIVPSCAASPACTLDMTLEEAVDHWRGVAHEYLEGYRNAQHLSDPIAVHANMLRGTIAKPSLVNIAHLYSDLARLVEAARAMTECDLGLVPDEGCTCTACEAWHALRAALAPFGDLADG